MKPSQFFLITNLLFFAAGCTTDPKSQDQVVALALLAAARPSQSDLVRNYASIAFANYSDVVTQTNSLVTAVNQFVGAAGSDQLSPSQQQFDAAKKTWVDARVYYQQSEGFRFANNGPINQNLETRTPDVELEKLVNSWPLDETLVENCIIANTNVTSSQLTEDFLLSRNTQSNAGGITGCSGFINNDKNILVGWHAIEYLLWGRDCSTALSVLSCNPSDYYTNSAGQRPLSYFTGSSAQATKARAYLRIATGLLLKHVTLLRDAWDPSRTGSYGTSFQANTSASLSAIFTGLANFSKAEWGGERLKIITTNDQEDEHSCFSDNTKADFFYDAQGVLNIYNGTYTRLDRTTISGTGIKSFAGSNDATASKNLTDARDLFCLNVDGPSMLSNTTSCTQTAIQGRYDTIGTNTNNSEFSKLQNVQTAIISFSTLIQRIARDNQINFTAPAN